MSAPSKNDSCVDYLPLSEVNEFQSSILQLERYCIFLAPCHQSTQNKGNSAVVQILRNDWLCFEIFLGISSLSLAMYIKRSNILLNFLFCVFVA